MAALARISRTAVRRHAAFTTRAYSSASDRPFFTSFQTEETGKEGSLEWRMHYSGEAKGEGKKGEVYMPRISPWHDIPLVGSGESLADADALGSTFTFVNEIPRGGRAKNEIATDELANPIKQDEKGGAPRYYHFDSTVNYGALPQTWEDPEHEDPETGCNGDNDPIDVCEVGERLAAVGEVYDVKLIGILAMIDDGETDWKVVAIRADDPLAERINSLDDAERHLPGKIAQITDWFRTYKMPDGKPENDFAFGGECQDAEFALRVIRETNASWKTLCADPAAYETGLWTPDIVSA